MLHDRRPVITAYRSKLNEKDQRKQINWLRGVALLASSRTMPMLACASKCELRAMDVHGFELIDPPRLRVSEGGARGRTALRLIINDDHGMMPTVTLVNQSDLSITVRAIKPALLSTKHGTYDLDALLAEGPKVIDPGYPLVVRIVDIGRNSGEPYRVAQSRLIDDSDEWFDGTARVFGS